MAASGIKIVSRSTAQSSESLDELAYRRLRAALIEGTVAPGEKLSIRKIAASFGTSAMPARTALRRLAAEQALDLLPSGSAVVPRLSREAFTTLCDIRARLEPMAVRMASGRLRAADYRKLALHLAAQDQARRDADPAAMLRADRDFLFTIYSACGSSLLLQFIESLWLRRGPLFWDARWMLLSRTVETHRHAHMIDALRRGDADEAAGALEEELDLATRFLLDNYAFSPERSAA